MVHEDASPQKLALARICVYGMWLWHVFHDPMQRMAAVPEEVFGPIGLLRLLPEDWWGVLLSETFLLCLKYGLLASLSLLFLGVGPFRKIAIPVCIALTFYQGITRGFGRINHGELAMLYAAYVLAVFHCNNAFALNRSQEFLPKKSCQAALTAITVVLALTYTFVGVRRFAIGGLEIFLDNSILAYIAHRSAEPGPYGMNFGLTALSIPFLSYFIEIGFLVLTVFEMLSLLVLSKIWFRCAWVVVLLTFHLSTMLFMQISFSANVVLIIFMLTPAPYIFLSLFNVWNKTSSSSKV